MGCRQRHRYPSAILLSALLASLSASTAAALGFPACVQDALRQNPAMLLARAKMAEARGQASSAEGRLLPRLSGSFSAIQSNNPLTVLGMKLSQRSATFNDFGAGAFSGPATLGTAPGNLDHPHAYHNLGTQLQLAIPIWDGGAVRSGIDETRAMLRAARSGNILARQQLVFSLLEAYDGVIAARSQVRVALKDRSADAASVKTTEQLFRRGVVLRSDLLAARVHAEEAGLGVQQARNALANALDNLEILIGWNRPVPPSVGKPVLPEMPSGNIAALEKEGLFRNPGIRALQQKVLAARAGVAMARASYMPHVNGVVKQEWNGTSLGNGAPSYTLGGQITWDALDFSRGGQVDAAHAKVEELLARLRQAQDRLRLQIAEAARAARVAAHQARIRELALEQSREAQRLLRLRYENGIETLTGLLQGQAELDHARSAVVEARYEEAVRRGALLFALGRMELADMPAPARSAGSAGEQS